MRDAKLQVLLSDFQGTLWNYTEHLSEALRKNLLPLPEQETRPMEFTQKQKELLTKVFHLDDTNRLLFHAEGIQIVSDGDTLLCTLSDARQKELLLSQKEDDIVLTIRPSCTGT